MTILGAAAVTGTTTNIKIRSGCGPEAEIGDRCPDWVKKSQREGKALPFADAIFDWESGRSFLGFNENVSALYDSPAILQAVDTFNGSLIWEAELVYEGHDTMLGRLVLDPDRDLLIASVEHVRWADDCSGFCFSEGARLELAALNATSGELVWRSGATPEYRSIRAQGLFLNETSATVGGSLKNPEMPVPFVFSYSLQTGDPSWEWHGSNQTWGEGLVRSAAGSIIVLTQTDAVQSLDEVVVRVAGLNPSDQTELWNRSYDGWIPEHREAIALSPDGATVFSAYSGSGFVGAKGAAIDTVTGSELWHADVLSGITSRNVQVRDIAVSSDGSKIAFLGISDGLDGSDDFTMALVNSTTGAREWQYRYDSPYDSAGSSGGEQPWDAAFNPSNGMLLMTGRSVGLTASDIITVATEPSSGQLGWKSRVGPGSDHGAGFLLFAANRVLVVGDASLTESGSRIDRPLFVAY